MFYYPSGVQHPFLNYLIQFLNEGLDSTFFIKACTNHQSSSVFNVEYGGERKTITMRFKIHKRKSIEIVQFVFVWSFFWGDKMSQYCQYNWEIWLLLETQNSIKKHFVHRIIHWNTIVFITETFYFILFFIIFSKFFFIPKYNQTLLKT